MYEIVAPEEPLTQGDVIDDCPLFQLTRSNF